MRSVWCHGGSAVCTMEWALSDLIDQGNRCVILLISNED